MKYIRMALFVLSFFYSNHSFAWGNWIDEPYDKVAHAGFSVMIVTGGYAGLTRAAGWNKNTARWTTFGTAVGVGLLKEISDQTFDPEDLAASVAGAALGLGLTFTF